MAWTVVFTPAAERDVRSLDVAVRNRIEPAILRLAEEPRPVGVQRLAGRRHPEYRIRVGDWRVVNAIDVGEGLVRVLRIGHRREVYR